MMFPKHLVFTGCIVTGGLLAAFPSTHANQSTAGETHATGEGGPDPEPEGLFQYQLETEKNTTQDDRFPFGSWEETRLYPVIVSESQPRMADTANEKIMTLVNRYRCDDMGDEAFKTQQVYLNSAIFSMAYEATWMCSSMPSPDSESGFLNLDLADGAEIELRAQFRTLEAYERFQDTAFHGLNRELTAQTSGKEQTCPQVRSFSGFYTDGKELIVASLSRQHGNAGCDVEVGFPLKSLAGKLKSDSALLAGREEHPGS